MPATIERHNPDGVSKGRATLRAEGADLANLVKVTVYTTDMR